jgi:hypothetical protein
MAKMTGVGEVQLHSFLSSTQDESYISRPSRFTLKEKSSAARLIGREVDCRAGLNVLEKISYSCHKSKPGSSGGTA